MTFYHAVFTVDGHAGEVTHMLVGARQLVEECGLAAVLLSGEGECQRGAFRDRVFVSLVVVDTVLTETIAVILQKIGEEDKTGFLPDPVFRGLGHGWGDYWVCQRPGGGRLRR